MSACISKALIVGGGFSGMATAIELSKIGIEVDLVEIDPNWRTDGAGITIGGATMRAFRQLGMLEDYLKVGSGHAGLDLYAPHGLHIAHLPTPPIAEGLPGSGAVMRPALAKVLADKTKASTVNVKLGVTFEHIVNGADGATVTLTDGTTSHYDMVIGADGLHSKVRATMFPEACKPKYVGQGVWRAVLPRLPEVNNTMMWLSEAMKVGVNPMSEDQMYMFVTEHRQDKTFIDPMTFVERLKSLVSSFSAPLVTKMAEMLNEDCLIDYRALDNLLVDTPWFKERVVMIGDTVHATTPHLASGACIGIEDGIVLAEELYNHSNVNEALQAFNDRRWERCKMVVTNSARLAEIEIHGGSKEEHANIMRDSAIELSKPI